MKSYKLTVDGVVVFEGTDRGAFLDAFEAMTSGSQYNISITPVAKSLNVSGTVA